MPDHQKTPDGSDKPDAPRPPGTDTRKRARRRVEGLILICNPTSATPVPTGPRVNIARQLIDISPGGIQFSCNEPLSRPCSLQIQIKDPSSGEVFLASGNVMWCAPAMEEGLQVHHVGVQFDELYTAIAKSSRFFFGPGTSAIEAPEPAAKPKGWDHPPRQGERYAVDDYVVTMAKEAPFWSFAKPKNIANRVVDLSVGGAHVECSEKLDPGARVHFTLHLNKFADTFSADAEVVWTRKLATRDVAAWRSGLEFRKLGRRNQMLLDHMISWFSSQPAKLKQGPKK